MSLNCQFQTKARQHSLYFHVSFKEKKSPVPGNSPSVCGTKKGDGRSAGLHGRRRGGFKLGTGMIRAGCILKAGLRQG